MTTSTKSEILDENTVNFAEHHWSGPKNSVVNVPITYVIHNRMISLPRGIPIKGLIKVTFNASGNAATAVMSQSTGVPALDQDLLAFARAKWVGAPRATSIVPVAVTLPVEESKRG